MVHFFEKIHAESGGRASEFFSSQPDPGNRISAVQSEIVKLGPPTIEYAHGFSRVSPSEEPSIPFARTASDEAEIKVARSTLSHLQMVDDGRHAFGFLRKLHSTFPLSLRIDDAR